MASSSRSKVSTKGRPQPKHGKKTAIRPSRLLTRLRPIFRATSPESIGEQIEVQLERRFIPPLENHPGGLVHPRQPYHMYHTIPMQIYLFILLCLTIPLNHIPIMNDARHQQEVGPSMRHLKPRKHLKVILISTCRAKGTA